VSLSCGAAAACDGTLRIQSAPATQAAAAALSAKTSANGKKKRAPVVTYASGTFSLSAGKSGAVAAKLSSAGRRSAHKHRRLKVWLNVTLGDSTAAKVVSHAVTLTF
jgi:pectate lyase